MTYGKKCSLIILALLVLCSPALPQDDNGILFEFTVREKPLGIDNYFEIIKDSAEIIVGNRMNILLVNMNLNIEVEEADSQSVTFVGHITTIGKDIYNVSKRFRIEYNLPARLDNIPGKGGTVYQLLISPRRRLAIDTVRCGYDPYDQDDFKMDPSANFDIYYVANSLADYQWSNIKNYLEYDYTQFKNALNINMSGKISIFLCPCPAPNVKWDRRFGYALHPGRANIYTLHNHAFSSVDAMLPNILMLLRVWGYAPPLLVEGLAGYFDFSNYKMRKLKSRDSLPPLIDLVTSRGYYGADPVVAEVMAGSFCKFINDQYGPGKFKVLYDQADDLTILKNMLTIYEKPLDSLSAEWMYYLDTVTLQRAEFDLNAARAAALQRFDEQTEYIEQMVNYDQTRYDSIDTRGKLSAIYYQTGEYYQAEESYRKLIEIDGRQAKYVHILANLAMVNGEYDRAYALFDSVMILDGSFTTARLMQARITAVRGDTAAALTTAEEYYPQDQNLVSKIEFLLFMGDIYGAPGAHYDSARAAQNFSDALVWAQELIPQAPMEPTLKMRAGQALLGLGEYDQARQYLEVAYFTELRTFYTGKILVSLGKVHDALGERETALEYYRQALAISITDYDRIECLGLMEKPYNN